MKKGRRRGEWAGVKKIRRGEKENRISLYAKSKRDLRVILQVLKGFVCYFLGRANKVTCMRVRNTAISV